MQKKSRFYLLHNELNCRFYMDVKGYDKQTSIFNSSRVQTIKSIKMHLSRADFCKGEEAHGVRRNIFGLR